MVIINYVHFLYMHLLHNCRFKDQYNRHNYAEKITLVSHKKNNRTLLYYNE